MEVSTNPIIRLFHVNKLYGGQKSLDNITLDIGKNDLVIVTGASGAGKSTLLKLLYLEEMPSQGQVLVDGVNTTRISRKKIPFLRRRFGIVFQDYRLIPTKTVFNNVSLVLEVMGENRRYIQKKVGSLLRSVGMDHKLKMYPPCLSGGEQQRVAIARAIAGNPKIIFADEPTGSLDQDSAAMIISLLKSAHQRGATVVIATHDRMLMEDIGGRIILLDQGRVSNDTLDSSANK